MIAALSRILARTLLEFGLLALIAAGLFLFFSYRLIRRLTVGGEDTLERYSGPLAHLAGAIAELAAVKRTRT